MEFLRTVSRKVVSWESLERSCNASQQLVAYDKLTCHSYHHVAAMLNLIEQSSFGAQ